MFTDGVVVGVVDHPQLPHHLPPNGRFYRPVVHFTVLLLPVQLLHVEDLGGQPVEDDPNVFDAEVVLLVDRELVDQQEELVGSNRLSVFDLQVITVKSRQAVSNVCEASKNRLYRTSTCFAVKAQF